MIALEEPEMGDAFKVLLTTDELQKLRKVLEHESK
jgi:hypothetical protein